MTGRRRDWDSITITDDIMFTTVFGSDAGLCRELVERVLGIPVDHVEYVSRERSLLPELGAKQIAMDVFVADDEGTVIDVEMQNWRKPGLERRSRYYQSANDMECIGPGEAYDGMRDAYLVFLCSFDPFGRGLPVYAYVATCRESGEELGDGQTRVFASIPRWEACEDERLRSLLRYMQTGIMGDDEFLRRVDGAVRDARSRSEWRESYMRFDIRLMEERAEGKAEGLVEGRVEGRSEGMDIAKERYRRLAAALREAGRADEFLDAIEDDELYKRLLTEFGIDDSSEERVLPL